MVVGGRQHQDLPCVAVVEHLSRAEGLESRHGHALLLLVSAAHRVDAAPAADARSVCLVVERLVQQGQAVVLYAAVWGWQETNKLLSNSRNEKEDRVSISSFILGFSHYNYLWFIRFILLI